MLLKKFKKNRFKPVFKQLLKNKINIITNLKILKLKRKKWFYFNFSLKTSLNKTQFKKYKVIDQKNFLLQKKNPLESNYAKTFKKRFIFSKVFNIFFYKLKNRYAKKIKRLIQKNLKINKIKNAKLFLTKTLESRLDFVLFKSKIYLTLRSANKAISEGLILVNKKTIKQSSFLLNSGDIIKIKNKKKIKKNLVNSLKWPIVPNFLLINYKTMEIIFLGNFFTENHSIFFYPFYFNLPNSLKL